MHAALHRHRKSDGDSSSSSGGGDQQQPGLVNSHGQGQQSSSQACIATLEAAGMLADSEGRRLTAEQRQRRLQERRPRMWRRKTAEQLAKEAAEDAAATIAAEALAAQQARRKLYDGMEQSLRDRGLALGAPLLRASVFLPAAASGTWPGCRMLPPCRSAAPGSSSQALRLPALRSPYAHPLHTRLPSSRACSPARLPSPRPLMCSHQQHAGHGAGRHVQNRGGPPAARGHRAAHPRAGNRHAAVRHTGGAVSVPGGLQAAELLLTTSSPCLPLSSLSPLRAACVPSHLPAASPAAARTGTGVPPPSLTAAACALPLACAGGWRMRCSATWTRSCRPTVSGSSTTGCTTPPSSTHPRTW